MMKDVVRLANPDAGPLKAYEDGGLDVVTRVTHKHMELGWSKLREVILEEPAARMREWAEDGHSEYDLRLLFGLFVTVSSAIPMSTSNFIEWLRFLDPDRVDEFVAWRVKQFNDEALEYVLEDRDLTGLGFERVDQPSNRGPASLAGMKRMIGKMSLDDALQIEAAASGRIYDLHVLHT